MAIVVGEQERSLGSFVGVFIWIISLFIVAIGGYYIFFVSPEIIPYEIPSDLQRAQLIADTNLDPEAVLNRIKSPAFENYVIVETSSTDGRANPFLPAKSF